MRYIPSFPPLRTVSVTLSVTLRHLLHLVASNSPRAPGPDAAGEKDEDRGPADRDGEARATVETVTAADKLSFEGSTEEVLRYTIVAKVSYINYLEPEVIIVGTNFEAW